MRKRNRQKKGKIVLVVIFLVGVALTLFPIVSQVMYYYASRVTIQEFDQRASTIDTSEIERRVALAQAYNEAHQMHNGIQDVFTQRQKDGLREYARMLEVNEQIGYVSIPKISQELPIYAGTTETVLQKGVGHLETTSLPIGGPNTHSVLTAHRGLPTARLFTDLDKLKKGDFFYVRNLKETLAYQVVSIKVVEPSDLDSVAVEAGKDYVTLLTCTPYMINSHRLLVTGERVNDVAKEQFEQRKTKQGSFYQYLFSINSVFVLLLILAIMGYRYKQKKRNIKKEERTYRH